MEKRKKKYEKRNTEGGVVKKKTEPRKEGRMRRKCGMVKKTPTKRRKQKR
jgi:hypothetical protein